MPSLSIIPSSAVADTELTDLQVRVLCAVGTFTNRLGGNVWASINTLAKQSNLSPRSVQRALPVLIDRGYLRKIERTGRTSVYEIVLGVTSESEGGDQPVTPPPTTQSPKRYTERSNHNDTARQVVDMIWSIYPAREEPVPYPAAVKAVGLALTEGADPNHLVQAAQAYAKHVERDGTEKKYRKSMVRFFTDGAWQAFLVRKVHGRTREEWARSGQDVAEWDRLSGAA